MFTLRFDMRAPESGASTRDLYAAAVEMAEWSEGRGCAAAILCEHHAVPDGYLPAPLILAAAIAARTTSLHIAVAAILLPLRDPIRLAEEMSVLDILSGGRVSYVAAVGYRPTEYELYGVDYRSRGRIAEDQLGLLLRAKTGEPFVRDGQELRVTPPPVTPGGPSVSWGGSSVAAARRAGRHGLAFLSQGGGSELEAAYDEAARANGLEPRWCFVPPRDMPTSVFVAEDLDAAWDELGPYLMHDARSYAADHPPDTPTASISFASTAEELRAENRSHRIVTVDEAVELASTGMPLGLHPLIGGLPPEIGWRYLRTVTDEVLPRLQP